MPSNRKTQTISLYVPEKAQQQQVTKRLMKLGEKRDRSIKRSCSTSIEKGCSPPSSPLDPSRAIANPPALCRVVSDRRLTPPFPVVMMARDRAMNHLTDRYRPLLIYIPEPR